MKTGGTPTCVDKTGAASTIVGETRACSGLNFLFLVVLILVELLGLSVLLVRGKAGMGLESGDLGLEELHVVGESPDGFRLALTGLEAGSNIVLSSLVLPPVEDVADEEEEEDDKDRSEHVVSLGVLLKERGQGKETDGEDDEHDGDVDDGESTPEPGSPSELLGGVNGDAAHEGDGVEDDRSGHVEEQVGKCDLEGLNLVGHQSSHNGRKGGSNVGSDGEGKHLLDLKDTDSDQRGQSGGGDGRGLDNHGHSATDCDGEVSVDVGGLVNDTGGHAEEHLLEDGDKTDEAEDEHEESKEEAHSSRDLIFLLGGSRLEEGRALVGLLVAANQTDGASLLGGVLRVVTHDGVEGVAGGSLSDSLDNVLVGDNDFGSEGADDLLDRTGPLLSVTDRALVDHGLGEVVQVSGNNLNGKENTNVHVVEHVVNSGSGKGTLELVSVSHLSHGDNGVGDGGSNVGSHYDVDGLSGGDDIRSDQGHNNRGGGRRRLDEGGGEDTDHESGNRVGVVSEEISGGTASNNLGGTSKDVQSKKEEVKEETHENDTDEDPHPVGGGVAAASLADLTPGGVTHFLKVLLNVLLLCGLRDLFGLGRRHDFGFFGGLRVGIERWDDGFGEDMYGMLVVDKSVCVCVCMV